MPLAGDIECDLCRGRGIFAHPRPFIGYLCSRIQTRQNMHRTLYHEISLPSLWALLIYRKFPMISNTKYLEYAPNRVCMLGNLQKPMRFRYLSQSPITALFNLAQPNSAYFAAVKLCPRIRSVGLNAVWQLSNASAKPAMTKLIGSALISCIRCGFSKHWNRDCDLIDTILIEHKIKRVALWPNILTPLIRVTREISDYNKTTLLIKTFITGFVVQYKRDYLNLEGIYIRLACSEPAKWSDDFRNWAIANTVKA